MKKLKEIWKEYKAEIISAGVMIVGVGALIFVGKKLSTVEAKDIVEIPQFWGVMKDSKCVDLAAPNWGDGVSISQFWKESDGLKAMIAKVKPERFADFAEKFASEIYTGANDNVIEVVVGG